MVSEWPGQRERPNFMHRSETSETSGRVVDSSYTTVVRDCGVIGLGQLGRLFGGAALACGYRTTPIRRGDALDELPRSGPIVVAVGEKTLPDVLRGVARKNDLVLVQNELFPDVWRDAQPTVAVVWSNVKKGRLVEIGRATHVFGKHASFVREVHAAVDIPCVELATFAELERELVAKYAFIVAVNALGLEEPTGRTVGEWLDNDGKRVDDVVARCVKLGEARVGHSCEGAAKIARGAMEPLRNMPAAGRTARERVQRARALAMKLNISW